MNPVFASSFEKRAEEERIIAAQVSIGERQGVWRIVWTEPDAGGKPRQIVWFEGGKWREMLHVFRTKLAEKTAEGFLPLVAINREETEADPSRPGTSCHSRIRGAPMRGVR